MKRILFYITSVILVVSCVKETSSAPFGVVRDDSGDTGKDKSLHIISNVGDLDWPESNRIVVFDSNDKRYELSVSGQSGIIGNQVEYIYEEWPSDSEPKYAIYNSQKDNPGTSSENVSIGGGKISVEVHSEQRPTVMSALPQFAPVLLARVINGGDIEDPSYTATFHQLTGYIRFSIGYNDIKTLAMSSVEGVNLAGRLSVETSSVEEGDFEYIVSEGSSNIVVEAKAGAEDAVSDNIDGIWCLKGSKTGYFTIAVIPGTFTPVFKMTDKSGNTVTVTATEQITVSSGRCVDLKIIDAPGNFVLEVVKGKSVATTDPAIPSLTSKTHYDSFKINIEDTDYVFGLNAGAEIGKNSNGLYLSTVKPVIVKLPEKEGYTLSSIYITPGTKIAGSVRLSSELGGVTTDGTLYYISNEGDGTNKSEGSTSNPTGAGLREVTINITDEYDANRIYYLKTGTGWTSNCLADFILTYSPLPIK